MAYQSKFVSLHDALALIARRLEAKMREEAPTNLLERLVRDFGEQLASTVTQALAMFMAPKDNATARFAAARAGSTSPSGEEEQWPSIIEAERQLFAAAADGMVMATGDIRKAPTAAPVTVDMPAAAFNLRDYEIRRDGSTIITPWGRYKNVKFIERDLNRIWPVTDPMVAEWVLTYAKSRAPIKIKKEDTIKLCMGSTGATWRQAETAFGGLPSKYVFKRGAPRRV